MLIGVVLTVFNRHSEWLARPPRVGKLVLTLALVVLLIMVGVTICVWVWAGAYMALGVFESLEEAIYFSIVSFTTLGLGDITLDPQWRILSALPAVNGLIIFGLSTAFMMEYIVELRNMQNKHDNT